MAVTRHTFYNTDDQRFVATANTSRSKNQRKGGQRNIAPRRASSIALFCLPWGGESSQTRLLNPARASVRRRLTIDCSLTWTSWFTSTRNARGLEGYCAPCPSNVRKARTNG